MRVCAYVEAQYRGAFRGVQQRLLVREQFHPVGSAALSRDRDRVEQVSARIKLVRRNRPRGRSRAIHIVGRRGRAHKRISRFVEQHGLWKRDSICASREIAECPLQLCILIEFNNAHWRRILKAGEGAHVQISRLVERHPRIQTLPRRHGAQKGSVFFEYVNQTVPPGHKHIAQLVGSRKGRDPKLRHKRIGQSVAVCVGSTLRLVGSRGGWKIGRTCIARHIDVRAAVHRQSHHTVIAAAAQIRGKEVTRHIRVDLGHKSVAARNVRCIAACAASAVGALHRIRGRKIRRVCGSRDVNVSRNIYSRSFEYAVVAAAAQIRGVVKPRASRGKPGHKSISAGKQSIRAGGRPASKSAL